MINYEALRQKDKERTKKLWEIMRKYKIEEEEDIDFLIELKNKLSTSELHNMLGLEL